MNENRSIYRKACSVCWPSYSSSPVRAFWLCVGSCDVPFDGHIAFIGRYAVHRCRSDTMTGPNNARRSENDTRLLMDSPVNGSTHTPRQRVIIIKLVAYPRPPSENRERTLKGRSQDPAHPVGNRQPCSFCPNSRSNLRSPARPRWLPCCTYIHRSYRAFFQAMNCSLNRLACRFHPTLLCPLPPILIPSAIVALASSRPLDTLGSPARTS
jgi:hypothetical protein